MPKDWDRQPSCAPRQKDALGDVEEFDKWTSCERYGHAFHTSDDGKSRRCFDCGVPYLIKDSQ